MKPTLAPQAHLTKHQQLILHLIEEAGVGTHLTAYELLAQAKKHRPNIGLATVHRALNQLYEDGLISRVEVPGVESATYEPLAEQHAHFRCKRCGDVLDVDYALPKRALNDIAARLGLQIDEEHLALTGLCAACLSPSKRVTRRA